MNVFFWAGLMAPAGTPPSIIERLDAEVKKAVAQPDVKERLAALEAEPFGLEWPNSLRRFTKLRSPAGPTSPGPETSKRNNRIILFSIFMRILMAAT